MNAAIEHSGCQVNLPADRKALAERYRARGHVQIPHFLMREGAQTLFQCLDAEISWRTFLAADNQRFEKPRGADALDEAGEREVTEMLHRGSKRGFAYLQDADRLSPEDASSEPSTLTHFVEELHSGAILLFVREVTGCAEIAGVQAFATRMQSGHFVTFRDGSAPKDIPIRANFEIQLTPHWAPEWGGLLSFRAGEGMIDAYLPCFASLVIYAYPLGHWISPVAPFANAPRYAIQGRFST